MNILYHIKHWLRTKIYYSCVNIEKEHEIKRLNDILSQMIFHGGPLYINERYRILGPQYMEFGDECVFGQDAWVECIDERNGQKFTPKLEFGNRFSMERCCHIGCVESISFGDNVLLGSNVYITDHYHGEISKESLLAPPIDRPLWSKAVKIGNNVWIGDNVCIMPGVKLEDNIIVGANSVVTHSFPANAVIAGCPARIVRIQK